MKRSEENTRGVENLEHRLRKTRLKWFGHVKRMDENSILRWFFDSEVVILGCIGLVLYILGMRE